MCNRFPTSQAVAGFVTAPLTAVSVAFPARRCLSSRRTCDGLLQFFPRTPDWLARWFIPADEVRHSDFSAVINKNITHAAIQLQCLPRRVLETDPKNCVTLFYQCVWAWEYAQMCESHGQCVCVGSPASVLAAKIIHLGVPQQQSPPRLFTYSQSSISRLSPGSRKPNLVHLPGRSFVVLTKSRTELRIKENWAKVKKNNQKPQGNRVQEKNALL